MISDDQSKSLVALFVDYDNVYLSLKRRNETAAMRFARNVKFWLKKIETGALIDDREFGYRRRRLAFLRCYGNPGDDTKKRRHNDPCSFPLVRNHFMRAGFEIIDCPPLTSRLKNSSDIRMALDLQDLVRHPVDIDEFIILSSDADFTPVLHRLRSYGRRTTIFTTHNTAAPYTAVSDAQIDEDRFIEFLLNDIPETETVSQLPFLDRLGEGSQPSVRAGVSSASSELIQLIMNEIEKAEGPPLLSFLADRAQRILGNEKTSGSNWAGHGSFRKFLKNELPAHLVLSTRQPHRVIDRYRFPGHKDLPDLIDAPSGNMQPNQQVQNQISFSEPTYARQEPTVPRHDHLPEEMPQFMRKASQEGQRARTVNHANDIHQIIAHIHEKTQLPALSPSEYASFFTLASQELTNFGLRGKVTAKRLLNSAIDYGIELDLYDVKFILDILSRQLRGRSGPVSSIDLGEAFHTGILNKLSRLGLALNAYEAMIVKNWFVKPAGFMRPKQPLRPHLDGQVSASNFYHLTNAHGQSHDQKKADPGYVNVENDRALEDYSSSAFAPSDQRAKKETHLIRPQLTNHHHARQLNHQIMPTRANRPAISSADFYEQTQEKKSFFNWRRKKAG